MSTSHERAKDYYDALIRAGALEGADQRLAPLSPEKEPLPTSLPHRPEHSEERRKQAEAWAGPLPALRGSLAPPDGVALAGNIENFIGMAQVPVGLAGPLRVRGSNAQGDFFVPLATSEGALVASYSRGARLVSQAGGVTCISLPATVQRAPGFVFERALDAARFAAWASGQFEHLAAVAASRSRFGRLVQMSPHLEGNHVHLVLGFSTGDAAGQNMVTLCAEAVCAWLIEHSPFAPRAWYVEANMSGDKKATAQSLLNSRGRKVLAEAVLPADLVEAVLHTTVQRVCEYWRMSFTGGAQTGSIGVSGHVANGLAAAFLATGQDLACVSEASIGITRLEQHDDGSLYASLTLPNLIVGSVGGGTRLPTAIECLRLLGCEGPGHANKLAEIIAALCLAGELSIIGALCSGDFASAHARLGRSKS